MWSNLKRNIRRHNETTRLRANVLDLIRQKIDDTKNDVWQNYVKHEEEVENSYL